MRSKAGIKIYDFNIDNSITNFFKIQTEENNNIIYQNYPNNYGINNTKFYGRIINKINYGIVLKFKTYSI